MMDIKTPDDWRYMSVREELDQGRLWKARDRLHGRLVDEPADQDVLGLLGDIYFAMGDLPQAGRYWWLTERDDDQADAARDAFTERFGRRAIDVLRALPRPMDPERYPRTVRPRYEAVIEAARRDDTAWMPSIRTPAGASESEYRPSRSERLPEAFFWAVIWAILALAAIGLVAVVVTLVNFVSG